MTDRKQYLKKYHKEHYARIRKQKTLSARAKRDRDKLLEIKKKMQPINKILEGVKKVDE